MNVTFTKKITILFLVSFFSFFDTNAAAPNWTPLISGTTNTLIGVSAIGNNICYVSGAQGLILKTSDGGATWVKQVSNTIEDLYYMHFINEKKGFAVGNNGSVQMTLDGGNLWTQLNITKETLRCVYFFNDSIGFISGTNGTILKTVDAGKTWVKTITGITDALYSVFFTNANVGFAEGFYGKLLKTTDGGNTWTVFNIGVSIYINSIMFTDESRGFLGVQNGVIMGTKDGGKSWNNIVAESADFPYHIGFTDNFNGYIVGGNVANNTGAIYHTTDGGTKWNKYYPGTSRLMRVDFANQKIGYAVGLNGTIIKFQSYSGLISGNIYNDKNKNCKLDVLSDLPLSNFMVKAEPGPYITFSDSSGNYTLGVDTGVYALSVTPSIALKDYSNVICPAGKKQTVTVPSSNSNIEGVNFGNEIRLCSVLKVDVSSDRMRRCFKSRAQVNYSNVGSAAASGVKIKVIFPEYVVPISSNPAWSLKEGNVLIYNIGTLGLESFGVINIVDSVICGNEAIRGLTQCIKAEISPANACLEPGTNWDKSSISVWGACVEGQVTGVLKNQGSGNMIANSEYRVFIDNILVKKGTFKLNAGDSVIAKIPSQGKTIRVEADQTIGHPGNSKPRVTIEACGTPVLSKASLGFYLQVPLDNGNIEVQSACLEIRDSYDPNDKQVVPAGLTSNHYISADDDLEYLIRFQNTGTDTAYNIILVDTLSPFVDVSTFNSGNSSHSYKVSFEGKGQTVKWSFKNIYLPDSTTDNPGSNGYVKYKIKQKAGNVKGTQITNKAYIYFDYNSAIITNETSNIVFDTVYTDYSQSSGITIIEPAVVGIIANATPMVKIYPNPTNDRLFINMYGSVGYSVTISNVAGQIVSEQKMLNDKAEIGVEELPAGIYIVRIIHQQGTYSGKIAVRK